MRPAKLLRLLFSALFVLLQVIQAGCGGGGSDPLGGNGGGTPSFSLSLNPSSLTVQEGASGTMLVTVTPQGGFNASISWFHSGLPSSVTPTIGPAGSAMTYNLQLAVDNTAPAGSYPFTLTGKSAGVADAIVQGTLVIQNAGTPSFSLSVNPSSISITKGSSGSVAVTVNPSGGFSGTVALSGSGQPAGVTVDFSPSSATTSSNATFTVGSSVATGTYAITINGTASGAPNASTTVSLVVTQPAGGTQITMIPCLQQNDVILFAVQDGSGPWTAVMGNGGAYSFSLASGRGAVAIVLRSQVRSDEIFTMVIMGSTAELALQMQEPCPNFQPVSGTYTAGEGHVVAIDVGIAGTSNFTAPAGGNSPWTAPAVMRKPLGDLFAAESIPGGATLKCILRRDIPLSGSNPSVGGDLNFGGAEAFVPGSAAVTLSGLASNGQVITGICHLWNPGLDVGVVGTSFSFGGGGLPPIAVVPASKLRSGDLQSITATAMPSDYATSNGTSPMLLSQYWMATPQDVTLNFQTPATPPTVSLSQSSPHPRLRFTTNFAAPYATAFIFNVVQVQGNSSSRGWQVLMSPGWISSGGSFPVDTPDLTSVAGWNSSWDLWPGVNLLWNTVNSGSPNGNTRVDGGRQWTCNYTAQILP